MRTSPIYLDFSRLNPVLRSMYSVPFDVGHSHLHDRSWLIQFLKSRFLRGDRRQDSGGRRGWNIQAAGLAEDPKGQNYGTALDRCTGFSIFKISLCRSWDGASCSWKILGAEYQWINWDVGGRKGDKRYCYKVVIIITTLQHISKE